MGLESQDAVTFVESQKQKNPLNGLQELTARGRARIWNEAERARLRLRRIQSKCLIADPFRYDSSGRCLDTDLATSGSVEYAQAYLQAIAVEYIHLRKPYRRLSHLLTAALKLVLTETIARWGRLDFDDRMSFESLCLPEVRGALLELKDQLLMHVLEEEAKNRPKRVVFRSKRRILTGRVTPGVGVKRESPSPDVASGSKRPATVLGQRHEAPEATSTIGLLVKHARALTVAKLIQELNDIKPQMLEEEAEYTRLRKEYPDFLTFKIADQRPDLKLKVLGIRGSIRHIRLAQELAAAYHGRMLSTIQDDWKDHKPSDFKRSR